MALKALLAHRLDGIAMGLSGLCVVHCIGTALLVGLLASASGFLGRPIIHEVGLVLAMIIGMVALGRGLFDHGFILPSVVGALGLGIMACALGMAEGGDEPVYTVLGVSVLALGHRLNVLAARHRL